MRATAVIFMVMMFSGILPQTILCQNPRDRAGIDSLYQRAEFLKRSSPDESARLSEIALSSSKKIEYHKGLALGFRGKSQTYQGLGKSDSALYFANLSVGFARKSGNRTVLAGSLRTQGDILSALDQKDEAVEVLFKALHLSEKTSDYKLISDCLNSLSAYYYHLKQLDLAAEYHKRRSELVYKQGITEKYAEIHANNVLFDVQFGYGPAEVRTELEKALFYARRQGDNYIIMNASQSLAVLYYDLGDFHTSNRYIDTALRILRQYPVFQDSIRILGVKARNELLLEKGEQAYRTIRSIRPGSGTSLNSRYVYWTLRAQIEDSLGLYRNLNFSLKRLIEIKDSIFDLEIQDHAQKNDRKFKVNELTKKNALLFKTADHAKEEKIVLESSLSNTRLYLVVLMCILGFSVVVSVLIIRQRRIRHETQLSEYRRKALLAQMNPHFTFNTMNSVQNYINKGDKKEATEYIGKFASLIRNILEFSEKSSITISEERTMLDTYLSLEKLRNENLSYHIDIDPELDESFDKLPSMIVQPFVENAVIHGIQNLPDGRGSVSIEFSKHGDKIRCTIEDNGIGRSKSAGINASNKLKRESRGLEMVSERLESLSRELKGSYGFFFADLFDDKGNTAGTNVTIDLPRL